MHALHSKIKISKICDMIQNYAQFLTIIYNYIQLCEIILMFIANVERGERKNLDEQNWPGKIFTESF